MTWLDRHLTVLCVTLLGGAYACLVAAFVAVTGW